jgi:hypothetical protein
MAADYHTLAKEATGFTVAEVDCTEADSKALCEKHSIRGYPTLVPRLLSLHRGAC